MTRNLSELVEALSGLREKATPGPWAYRPSEYDDWGYIRGAETEWSIGTVRPIVAISRSGSAHADHDEHRRNKTDPYEPNGRLIVETINALPTLLATLQLILDPPDALVEALGEAAWNEESLRAAGRARLIPWNDELPETQNRWRGIVRAALTALAGQLGKVDG